MSTVEDLLNNEADIIEDVDSPDEETVRAVEEAVEVNVNQENAVETVENDGGSQSNDDQNKTADSKPKKLRKPIPKLNAETLKGPRGIHTLPKLFENIKFKGPGFEEQDLTLLMRNYEYWCHRLFPILPFDDCLEKLETLGHKKPVQTHIKKIRLDMLTDDILTHEDNEILPSDGETADTGVTLDPFDAVAPSLTPVRDEPVVLTNDQRERIRLNRERAMRIRMERMGATSLSVDDNSRPSTSGLQSVGNVSVADGITVDGDGDVQNGSFEDINSPPESASVLRVRKRRVVIDSSDEEQEQVDASSDTARDGPVFENSDVLVQNEHIDKLTEENHRVVATNGSGYDCIDSPPENSKKLRKRNVILDSSDEEQEQMDASSDTARNSPVVENLYVLVRNEHVDELTEENHRVVATNGSGYDNIDSPPENSTKLRKRNVILDSSDEEQENISPEEMIGDSGVTDDFQTNDMQSNENREVDSEMEAPGDKNFDPISALSENGSKQTNVLVNIIQNVVLKEKNT